MGLSLSRRESPHIPLQQGENPVVVHEIPRPTLAQRRRTVVYLPGDVQDIDESRMLESGAVDPRMAARYNLAATAARLAEKHGAARCVAVRAHALHDGFARFDDFCPRCRADHGNHHLQ